MHDVDPAPRDGMSDAERRANIRPATCAQINEGHTGGVEFGRKLSGPQDRGDARFHALIAQPGAKPDDKRLGTPRRETVENVERADHDAFLPCLTVTK